MAISFRNVSAMQIAIDESTKADLEMREPHLYNRIPSDERARMTPAQLRTRMARERLDLSLTSTHTFHPMGKAPAEEEQRKEEKTEQILQAAATVINNSDVAIMGGFFKRMFGKDKVAQTETVAQSPAKHTIDPKTWSLFTEVKRPSDGNGFRDQYLTDFRPSDEEWKRGRAEVDLRSEQDERIKLREMEFAAREKLAAAEQRAAHDRQQLAEAEKLAEDIAQAAVDGRVGAW